jgi:hypothetical protein
LNSANKPADLSLFGKGPTFEALARKYAPSEPVRALVDELLRINAVELLSSQRLRAIASIAVFSGLSEGAIEIFRARTSELISTLLHNARNPAAPLYVASAYISPKSPAELPVIKKQISDRATRMLEDVNVYSNTQKSKGGASKKAPGWAGQKRLIVTVYMSESSGQIPTETFAQGRRKNYSRKKSALG